MPTIEQEIYVLIALKFSIISSKLLARILVANPAMEKKLRRETYQLVLYYYADVMQSKLRSLMFRMK